MRKLTVTALIICVLICVGCRKMKKEQDVTIDDTYTMTEVAADPVEGITTSPKLQIVANIQIKPIALKAIMPHFKAMVEASENEAGCIAYHLHHNTKDSTLFIMIEEWQSQEAIDIHNNSNHMKAFKTATQNMILKSDVTILKKVY